MAPRKSLRGHEHMLLTVVVFPNHKTRPAYDLCLPRGLLAFMVGHPDSASDPVHASDSHRILHVPRSSASQNPHNTFYRGVFFLYARNPATRALESIDPLVKLQVTEMCASLRRITDYQRVGRARSGDRLLLPPRIQEEEEGDDHNLLVSY